MHHAVIPSRGDRRCCGQAQTRGFLETKHRYIYNSALRLYQADIEVSLITVYDDLAYHKLLDEVGGQPGLAYIAGLLPSHNPQAIAKIMMRDWRDRQYKYDR
uniref:DnaB-like helicase N-terminal domain-containing protein n=1 Tax=Desertifilum tharense IPPAS B-1220 TaxID=1781255 RepID=A0ACD5H2U2_9CYAN